MSSRSFLWFGQRVVRPRGLRKSPGSNWLSRCVANELTGKKGGGAAGVRQRFVDAARACARDRRGN